MTRLTSIPVMLVLAGLSVSGAWASPSDPGTGPDEPTAQQAPADSSDPDPPEDTEEPPSGGDPPASPDDLPGQDESANDPEDPQDTPDDSQPAAEPVEEPSETAEPEAKIDPPAKRERRIPNRYIVVFKKSVGDVDRETEERERTDPEGFESLLRYEKAIKGFTAKLSQRQVARLQADPEVDFITPDREVEATGTAPLAEGEPVPPTGVRRVEAATNTTAREASGVNVAVIDTGIQLGHADLNASQGTDCVDPGTQAGDDNGHGTHVAGTIAARNNGSGVVGVAPNTKLYAVKVLNSKGSGTISQVICGIDWVTANAASLNIKVANMSLGGGGPEVEGCSTTTDAEHKAICASVDAGVTYVVAAGNSGWDFDYEPAPDTPAAYPEVLTVTAASDSDGLPGGNGPNPSCRNGESDDRFASFSNYAATSGGEAHTIAAPGVCIKSTWKGGGYNTISGTSMAAPHVAGAVALCLNDGGAAGPCDGDGSPAEIIQTMRSQAKDHTVANPAFGFTGDPAHPVSGKYFGYLDWVGMPGETTRPTVGSVSPADGATAVDRGTNIAVSFSEPMDKSATEAAFSLVKAGTVSPIPGSFSWNGDTMTFDPATDLEEGALHTATVATGARDVAGNTLATQKQWSFTTIDSPGATTATDFTDATTILTGSPRSTSATSPPRLDADDNVFFEVNSTTSGARVTAWYGRFLAAPDSLSELVVTYRGRNSRKCTQTLSIWDWTASSWLALDSRAVSTTEVQIERSPSDPSRFVGGPSGDEVRVQVRCTKGSGKFYARGDLLRIAYTRP